MGVTIEGDAEAMEETTKCGIRLGGGSGRTEVPVEGTHDVISILHEGCAFREESAILKWDIEHGGSLCGYFR